MFEQFIEVDKLRIELLTNEDLQMNSEHNQDDVSSQVVLNRIENVILEIVTILSKGEAPVLVLPNRSSWANVSFDMSVGLHMTSGGAVTTVRSDCSSTVTKFGQILKVLSSIYKLVQSNAYATKRDIYYNNTQHFGSQRTVDSIVDDISCMLKLATSKGLISGDLCYLEEDGTRVNCHSNSSLCNVPFQIVALSIHLHNRSECIEDGDIFSDATPVSSNVVGITNIVSSAKFVLIVEKDATFQRLLDDDVCYKLSPCIMITGKGVPDVNSRLMVRKLWDTLRIPVFALVDADPHGIEIMCIYKYGSVAMSFEAHSLTVPSVMWLGLLPSDLQRLGVPEEALIPLTQRDMSKLTSLKKRPYLACQPVWHKEIEIMQQSKMKAEIQSLASITPDFLSRVYLPNKLRYGGWI